MKDMGMRNHPVLLTAPVAKTSTFVTPHVKLSKFESVTFYIMNGVITTDGFVLTITASGDNAGGTPTALSFKYRLTAAAGTDTLGDVSAAVTSLDMVHDGAYDGTCVIVEVDGAELTADKPYVGCTITDPGAADSVIAVMSVLKPRYPQATNSGALT